MTYAYFYLLGQNIAYFSTTCYVSVPITAVVGLIAALASGFADLSVIGLIFGWLSAVYFVEKRLKFDTALLNFNKDPSAHFHGVILGLEIILFAAFTLLLLVDDGSVILWLTTMIVHAFYMLVSFLVNKASKRIPNHYEAFKFFFVYFAVVMFTDSFFVVISMIVHDRRQNLKSIVVVTVLTQAFLYFIERQDIDKYLPKLQQQSPQKSTVDIESEIEEHNASVKE